MKLTAKIFNDEDAAREHLEAQRWPQGPVCPHCGATDEHVKALPPTRGRPSKAHPEGKERRGVHQCNACRQQFTVTVGTLFERSKIPLHQWLAATFLLSSSKKGMSAHQLHRMLGVTYKTAWFMAHRIRAAMADDREPLGGEGQTVEADETYFGKPETLRTHRTDGMPYKSKSGAGPANKRAIVGLVERGGRVSTFHVETATKASVGEILRTNAHRESRLHTDESPLYVQVGREYASHETVRHSAHEYARGDVHTNSIENYWSIFKRGMKGVYQHCAEKHLHRYLAEFDFRYNRRTKLGFDDETRANAILRRIEGKRLTYRRTGEAAHA